MVLKTLTSDDVVKIMEVNFGYEREDDGIFGEVIPMPPNDALAFSLIVGAPYMINEVGYSMKGRMEVLIHRSVFQHGKYIYTPGLFGRDLNLTLSSGESSYEIYQKHPEIFTGDKKLVIETIPTGGLSNIENQVFEKTIDSDNPSSDYLLFKVFESGSGLEPFLEYLCSREFSKKGFVTENQVPWFNQAFMLDGKRINGGIPDFSAFATHYLDEIRVRGFLRNFRNIQEFSTLFLHNENGSSRKSNTGYYLALCEVKTSKAGKDAALRQLNQYKATKLPNELFSFLYDQTDAIQDDVGLINIDDDHKVNVRNSEKQPKFKKSLQERDETWLNDYVKFYLLSNLSFENVQKFIRERLELERQEKLRSYHLVRAVVECPDNECLDYVEENIEYAGVW